MKSSNNFIWKLLTSWKLKIKLKLLIELKWCYFKAMYYFNVTLEISILPGKNADIFQNVRIRALTSI